jgi:hypothetical protein
LSPTQGCAGSAGFALGFRIPPHSGLYCRNLKENHHMNMLFWRHCQGLIRRLPKRHLTRSRERQRPWWMATTHAAIALSVALAARAEARLIPNGSSETVPGGATGQGILPAGWEQCGPLIPGADTYSNDGSYGAAPSEIGNFTGVKAFHGIRWVAGAAFGRGARSTTVGGEAFGTTLQTPLTPGTTYELKVRLHQALRSDLNNPGGYHVFLAEGNTPSGIAGALLVGTFAPTTMNAWEVRSVAFVAPCDAASRPFLVFAPYQSSNGNAYPGIDAALLAEEQVAAVPEPAKKSVALLCAVLSGARYVRRLFQK